MLCLDLLNCYNRVIIFIRVHEWLCLVGLFTIFFNLTATDRTEFVVIIIFSDVSCFHPISE